MAYARKTRKMKPRRRMNKKRNYRKKRSSAITSWYPFGASRLAKLRYSEVITIDPAASSIGSYVFSANGLYDPNISGTGHQPYGFDQLMYLYNVYMVLGAKISVFPMTGTTATQPYILGVKLSDSASLSTSYPYELLEQPGYKKRFVSCTTASPVNKVTETFSARKFFKVKNRDFAAVADDYHGTSTTNPTNSAFFIICYCPAISGADLSSTTFQVQIDYIAMFTGPHELSAS